MSINQSYEKILPTSPQIEVLYSVHALEPFSSQAIDFVSALSGKILSAPESKLFPELVALAFWMRRANLVRLQKSLFDESKILVPRGTVFHIAPSNVDSIFIYSWFLSLLAGNKNIVRVSTKKTDQTEFLLKFLISLLQDTAHTKIAERTLLVRYPSDQRHVTQDFSSVCDVRVVWGGDATVASVREIPLPPTAVEILFANKYSLAMINADYWNQLGDVKKQEAAHLFFNDAYWFDQMACSSPRLILWVGGDGAVKSASDEFWEYLERHLEVAGKQFEWADYMSKFIEMNAMAIGSDVQIKKSRNNNLSRVWINSLELFQQHHCGAGLFFETTIPNIAAIRPLLARKIQTLSYLGFERADFNPLLTPIPPQGIDRIVPFGKALDFTPVWDGYDLFRSFTREITFQ